MTISLKKVGALLSSFLLILSCQPTIINTVPKETPKTQILNNKTFSKKSLDCYIDYLPRSNASIISHSGGIVQYDAHMALANGKIGFDSYVSVGPDGIPFSVEFNVGRLKDGDTVGVSGIGRQVYGFGSIGQSFGGKLWEIPLSGTVTLKDGKLNLKFSGNVANCTTGRAELAICGQNGSEKEPLGGSIEAEIPYNGCLSLELSRDVVSFNPDNDSEFNSVDLNVNASNFINSNLFAAGKIVKSGKGNYSETLNKDNHYDIPDGRHRVDVNGGYYQSDSKTLKVDSTPPEVVDVNIDDSSEPIKIKVKVKDPEVNGFSSGIDKDETKIESSLGGSSTCDGETITYTLPIDRDFNRLVDSLSIDLKVVIVDKVKNKYKEPISSLDVTHNLEISDSMNFNAKYDHVLGDSNNKIENKGSFVMFSPKSNKPSCSFNFRFMNRYLPAPLGSFVFKEIRDIDLTYKVEKINFIPLNKSTPLVRKLWSLFGSEYIYNKGNRKFKISVEKEIESKSFSYPEDIADSTFGIQSLSVITHFFNSNGSSVFNKNLEAGFYRLRTTYARVIQGINPKIQVKVFPDNPLIFQIIDGATGNGNYSSLDEIDDKFLKRRSGEGFDDDQKINIYKENRKIHKEDIKKFIDSWNQNEYTDENGNKLNPNKIPLTQEQEERILYNDSENTNVGKINAKTKGNIIEIPPFVLVPKNSSNPSMPLNFPYTQQGEVDHIVAENVASNCCEKQGTNHYSNARIIGKNENGSKNNECYQPLN